MTFTSVPKTKTYDRWEDSHVITGWFIALATKETPCNRWRKREGASSDDIVKASALLL
jgi:hypothetical protein